MDSTEQVLIVGFVVAITKALRTRWPTVDGVPYVTLIAAIVGMLTAAVLDMSMTGKISAQTIVRGTLSGVAAVGGVTAIDRIKAPPAKT